MSCRKALARGRVEELKINEMLTKAFYAMRNCLEFVTSEWFGARPERWLERSTRVLRNVFNARGAHRTRMKFDNELDIGLRM